jgi:PhnB protein
VTLTVKLSGGNVPAGGVPLSKPRGNVPTDRLLADGLTQRGTLSCFNEDSPMEVQPNLFFDGRCDEAIDFYKKAIGAEVAMLLRFKDSPEPHRPGMLSPGAENKVMHGRLRIGETTILVSDGRCTGQPTFQGFSLSITVNSDADAERYFNALADGGVVHMPMGKTFFSSRFGMVADRFGVMWMVYVKS